MRPAVISFYSYKGGVGRTLLAANMAIGLAREGKTLLWDMDAEAPGLHNISALRNKGSIKAGFFDWLLDWQKNKLRQPGEQDLGQLNQLIQATPFKDLFILPAHSDQDDVDPAKLYFAIEWENLLGGDAPPARDVFNALLEHLGREGYRHVLIDTRTGLTDLGALLAGILPDATVLVGGYGRQNIRGLGKVYQALTRLNRAIRPSNTDLKLFPVASPIPQEEASKLAAGREIWNNAFGIEHLASAREVRYDTSLPFSEDLLIKQPESAVSQDYERIYQDLSEFVGTLFADAAAAQAEQDSRPDIFERTPNDPRSSRAAQGKRFEDRVADLLRLLGYSIEREQLIGPDRVDLIARIDSGLDTLVYFVECKDHKNAASKEVVDLLGLWLSKPTAQAMHARGMVVANAFSPAALASAKDLGITTATPQDLERRLLDFDKYLFQLIANFEQLPLASSYVTQRTQPEPSRSPPNAQSEGQTAQPTNIEDLIAHGIEWANGRDSRLWVLLGDYGTGKTAFTDKLAYELAKRAKADGSAPIPLRVNLRDFPNKIKLDDLLAERWFQATGQRKDPRVLLHLIQRGRIVLIFDAFDEMGIATAGRSVVEQFRMLVSIAANPGDTATGNRVLITCREQFFKDHGEAIKAANGEEDRIATSALLDVAQRFDSAIHTVATFTPDQVRQFLIKRLGEVKAEEALEFLHQQNLMSLGDRPQLLDIIIASLPELKERQARSGETLSTGALYQTYTNRWLDDAKFKPVERQSTSNMLRNILEELALQLWQHVGNRLHYGDLFSLVKSRKDLIGQLDPNQLDVELRTAAFLSRTPDGLYGFSHRSFLEFFLARRIERSVCNPDTSDVAEALDIPRLSAETVQFLHDLVPVSDSTRRGTMQTAVRRLMEPSTAPGAAPASSRVNALWLAYRMARLEEPDKTGLQKSMVHWIPKAANLAGLDLSEMHLSFFTAPGADFRQSKLTRCVLWAADLEGANLDDADLRHANLMQANLTGCRMQRVDASDSHAIHAKLAHVDATGSLWRNADLQSTDLSGTNFTNADLRAAYLAGSQGAPQLDQAMTQGLTARNTLGWPASAQALTTPNLGQLSLAPAPWHVGDVNAVAFSTNGQHIATGSNDGTLRLWDVDTGQCLRALTGHESGLTSVTFSPDGLHIASGSHDHTLRLWDVDTGQCLRVMTGHEDWVTSVAFSPNGQNIVSGSHDRTLCLWDSDTGQCLRVMAGHEIWVMSVAYSPNGLRIASGDGNGRRGTLRLWDADTGQCLRDMAEHEESVLSVAFSPNGLHIASGSDDGTLRLWDLVTGQCLRVMAGHEDSVTSVAFSPNGQHIASGSRDSTLRLWDVDTGQCLRILSWHEGCVFSVAFSPNGLHIASGSDDGTLRLWDLVTGKCLRVIAEHQGVVQSVAFSPDGQHIASGGNDRTLRLWDAATGQCLRVMAGDEGRIRSVAFSPNSQHIASIGSDGRLRLWDAATGQCLRAIEGDEGTIQSMAFSPDGQCIASGGTGNTGSLRLWDAATGQCLRTIQGHQGPVHSVAFSPDGQHIASSGDDGTLCLWQTDGFKVLEMRAAKTAPGLESASLGDAGQWVTLDFRQDPRGLWSGQGDVVETVRYVDATDLPQPWPWVPRYWRARDVPELQSKLPLAPQSPKP